jgi:hypothetical protein
MINRKGYRKKRSWVILQHYLITCLQGLRKITRNLSGLWDDVETPSLPQAC